MGTVEIVTTMSGMNEEVMGSEWGGQVVMGCNGHK